MFDGMAEELPYRTEIGLAGRSPGNLVDNRDVVGDFVARQPCAQELDERGGVDGRSIPQLHHRNGGLAEAVVGPANYRRASHRGMAFERRAYVVRHHLETAADDGLVGAAQDPQEAVCVDSGHVGGLHPLGGRSELSGFDLQQPGLVGTQRAPS